jgi:hypothetical protein
MENIKSAANNYQEKLKNYKAQLKLLNSDPKEAKKKLTAAIYVAVKKEMIDLKSQGKNLIKFIVSDERDAIDSIIFDVKNNLNKKGLNVEKVGLSEKELNIIFNKAIESSGILDVI